MVIRQHVGELLNLAMRAFERCADDLHLVQQRKRRQHQALLWVRVARKAGQPLVQRRRQILQTPLVGGAAGHREFAPEDTHNGQHQLTASFATASKARTGAARVAATSSGSAPSARPARPASMASSATAKRRAWTAA